MTLPSLSKVKIETKLAIIREALEELRKIVNSVSQEQFLADKSKFAVSEHYLRRSLEAVFEIAAHIVSRFPMSPSERPDSYKGLAKTLGRKKIVEEKFADETLVKMAGYRNRLVHEYDEITSQEMYEIITTKLADFEIFAKAVVRLVDKPEAFGFTAAKD